MKNVFITTPAVDEDEKSGFIYIGTSENRGLLPNSPMQPAVRGLNYLNTIFINHGFIIHKTLAT